MNHSDPVKIGIANNVESRMYDLQIGNPQELNILYKLPMNSRRHAHMVENRLHRQLKRHNIRGEWFRARALHKINFKQLLSEREHEKFFNEDDWEMICEANRHI